ncbi:hypothetical protein VTI74DRAFT_1377 [Chaetomium olivicolor]
MDTCRKKTGNCFGRRWGAGGGRGRVRLRAQRRGVQQWNGSFLIYIATNTCRRAQVSSFPQPPINKLSSSILLSSGGLSKNPPTECTLCPFLSFDISARYSRILSPPAPSSTRTAARMPRSPPRSASRTTYPTYASSTGSRTAPSARPTRCDGTACAAPGHTSRAASEKSKRAKTLEKG